MDNWRDLHDAPRDKPVWLFLPCAKFDADANGRPTNVSHESVVAAWSGEHSVWLTKDGRHVYPSMWSDAPVDGPMPSDPLLKAS